MPTRGAIRSSSPSTQWISPSTIVRRVRMAGMALRGAIPSSCTIVQMARRVRRTQTERSIVQRTDPSHGNDVIVVELNHY